MGIRPLDNALADQTLAADVKGVQNLRAKFQRDQAAGLKAAAQEFEAMFLQMVMKSMRATLEQDGFMDSDASRFFTGMFDEQMAKNLSQTGSMGLAQMLEAQLSQRLNAAPPEESEASEMANSVANSVAAAASISDRAANLSPDAALLNAGFLSAGLLDFLAAQERTPAASAAPKSATGAGEGSADFATPRAFAGALWSDAVEAGRNTGIPPQFLIAHAALESGWGRRNLKNADGSPSYNLFGIKAGGNWQGKTTDVVTTEYVHGAPVRQTERFRAYDSYAESFADYAQLLRDSPRYGSVIGSQNGTEFARRLQQAGYATDPKYAEKLAGIINGPTLRDALLG